jgi:RES domain
MSAPLRLPPSDLHGINIETIQVSVASLYRISKYASGEPYFGRSAGNRFDDRSRPPSKRFGTCYLGLSLQVAIAETVLHDLMPEGGHFVVPPDELESKQVVRFQGGALKLAKLAGTALKRIVGSSEISMIFPYDLPQAWAMALHSHPAKVDGLLYMSKQVNDEQAVVIFNRARRKFKSASFTTLPHAPGFDVAIKALNIRG